MDDLGDVEIDMERGVDVKAVKCTFCKCNVTLPNDGDVTLSAGGVTRPADGVNHSTDGVTLSTNEVTKSTNLVSRSKLGVLKKHYDTHKDKLKEFIRKTVRF
jgi:hypothetical protein